MTLALKELIGIDILLMWFGYFYLYLLIGGEVIKKGKKKSKTFFYQPNHTLFKDRTQFSLVLFGEWHCCFDVIMPLCNYSGICD
jgi:hypothetical protein